MQHWEVFILMKALSPSNWISHNVADDDKIVPDFNRCSFTQAAEIGDRGAPKKTSGYEDILACLLQIMVRN